MLYAYNLLCLCTSNVGPDRNVDFHLSFFSSMSLWIRLSDRYATTKVANAKYSIENIFCTFTHNFLCPTWCWRLCYWHQKKQKRLDCNKVWYDINIPLQFTSKWLIHPFFQICFSMVYWQKGCKGKHISCFSMW